MVVFICVTVHSYITCICIFTGITASDHSVHVTPSISKSVMTVLFQYKLPMDCILEIYSYCYDIQSLRACVMPILSSYTMKHQYIQLDRSILFNNSTTPSQLELDEYTSVGYNYYITWTYNKTSIMYYFHDGLYKIFQLKKLINELHYDNKNNNNNHTNTILKSNMTPAGLTGFILPSVD